MAAIWRSISGRASTAARLGNTCWKATPTVGGGLMVMRSATIRMCGTPPETQALTVTSGPVTHSSTMARPVRDSAMASATADASPER